MKKKILIITIVVAVIAGITLFFYLKNSAPNKISWRTSPVIKGDIKIEVTATGTLFADTTVDVGTQVSGTIAKLFADFNSVVKRGQVIAVLDTTFLAAAVEDATANARKAQVALDQSKRDYDRVSELFREK